MALDDNNERFFQNTFDSNVPHASENSDFLVENQNAFDNSNLENVRYSLDKNYEVEKNRSKNSKSYFKHFFVSFFLIVLFAGIFFGIFSYTITRKKNIAPTPLTKERSNFLNNVVSQKYHKPILHPLPYPIEAKLSNIQAKSVIIFDASNGNVVYEKNADIQIPPASMQKLMVMYIVFKDLNAGKISLNDIVPIPKQALAKNLPSDASVMNLKEGQIVTLNDLLMGMAVPSGNDAAVAVANYISGSQAAFVRRMNNEAQSLGMGNTFFADVSGYSALNVTTAREFASFCRIYVLKYPEALQMYNSAKLMKFPQKSNLPANSTEKETILHSTNSALDKIEGCDGLKTGFIEESGYNIALTVKKSHSRFIAVIMGGEGKNSAEGNQIRLSNCINITNWFYSNFQTLPTSQTRTFPIAVWGGVENSLNLLETLNSAVTVPNLMPNAVENVQEKIEISKNLTAPIQAGQQCGKIVYLLGNKVLQEVPLIADRSIERGSYLKVAVDSFIKKLSE